MATADARKPVVIFRSEKGPDDPYAKALREAGFDPQFVQVLRFEFRQAQELASALLNSSKFSACGTDRSMVGILAGRRRKIGMVLTSQTAIEACVHSLSLVSAGMSDTRWQEELTKQWKSLPVFVVGKATSQAVGKLGLTTTGSVSGSAEALSQTILEYFQSHDKATLSPLLFPCGSMRREILPTVLPEGGVNVHSIMCYDTLEDPNIAANLKTLAQKKVLSDGCWVVFFSPSGVKFALHHLKLAADTHELKIAAIGPTTAEALTSAGLPPSAVASKPSPNSLIQAMLNVHR